MEPNVHMVSWLMASAALSTYMQNLHGNLLLTFPDPISRPKSTTTNMWKCMHYQYLAKQNEGTIFRTFARNLFEKQKKDTNFLKESTQYLKN